jgi:hypothetical protein
VWRRQAELVGEIFSMFINRRQAPLVGATQAIFKNEKIKNKEEETNNVTDTNS